MFKLLPSALCFGLLTTAASSAYCDQIRWFGSKLVSSVFDLEAVDSTNEQCVITDGRDPYLVLKPTKIDANKEKCLYVKLTATSGASLQVFFGSGGAFSEEHSFRSQDVVIGDKPAVYLFDLSKFKPWKGNLDSLRIDMDGAEKGAIIALHSVGVSRKPVRVVDGEAVVEMIVGQAKSYDYRMAAWHETMVATDELKPNSCVSTYVKDKFSLDCYSLVKLIAGVAVKDETIRSGQARNVVVKDDPGVVTATYNLRGIRVTTRIIPLMVGRDSEIQEGAALYTISTEPRVPVVVQCGEGSVNGFAYSRSAWLREPHVGREGDKAEIDGDTVHFGSAKHPLAAAIRTDGKTSIATSEAGGRYCEVKFPSGGGNIVISYGPDRATAGKIAALDVKSSLEQVGKYYVDLLRCRIETPEKAMNDAFRSALYNLEYNWLKPYGWNECIHHWLALWHMQHTAAAEWIGQADRSRDCNITTAEHLLDTGAIPQFMPSGATKRDFGGSNQFWAWQIRHYWNFTADRAAIKKLAPYLDKVIDQTYTELDPEKDDLLAWGQQIGNQEDYVSTPFNGTSPSIEGINMMRTAAEFARALGQEDKAQAYDLRANIAADRLRAELWRQDLGRYAFFKDPLGEVRLDGQYHTLIYPSLWGLLDPLDSWTSIRHLRDTQVGADGECYLSNGFPNHWPGTWGMQAGAAQQPWAAWGLAAVGLRNETYRPLKAVADWVMNSDHRGSWPEISTESTPAYFSPPAGLYVQSTIEALFGLQLHKPESYLAISPSFPDHWPSARLTTPDYGARYTRTGNIYEYRVFSKTPLQRRLRWMLPPCKIKSVTVNGKAAAYRLEPGVACVILTFNTPACKLSSFQVKTEPIRYSVACPPSVAEGDEFHLNLRGVEIERFDDRCGVFSSVSLTDGLRAVVKSGQLQPYAGFGRLGKIIFSRRSFFVLGNASGVKFWIPIDITILPRCEYAAKGEVTADGKVSLLVRNNSAAPLAGIGILKSIQQEFPFQVNAPARSERTLGIHMPVNTLALLSPGDNAATVVTPNQAPIAITLIASKPFTEAALADYAESRVAKIALPEDKLKPDTGWRDFRNFYAYGHWPWMYSKPPLEALNGKKDVTVPGLPAVSFDIPDRKLIPISAKTKTPSFTLDLGGVTYKKLYLLIVPFLDNHDTWSEVARVDVHTQGGGIISRTLRFPGDLDWWCPEEVVSTFATAHKPRSDRFGLLPLLKPKQSLWSEGMPPAFPQPEFWATCLPFKTASSVMNVIELDLGRPLPVDSLTFTGLGADPAFGLVAISAEGVVSDEALAGTRFELPSRFREPRMVFRFIENDKLLGWKFEGNAFSVASVPSLFTTPTLNSLAKAGESAVGKAISPEFRVGIDDNDLIFEMQGGNSLADSGPGTLIIRLIDAKTGEMLTKINANGSHILREGRMSVANFRSRAVRLELVDENTGDSYAWLGIREVKLSAK